MFSASRSRQCVGVELVLLALLQAGCGGRAGDNLTKYPVTGGVRVNGKPEKGLIVRFLAKGPKTPNANAGYPVGITNEQGVYELSTNGVKDGAVAGTYDVVILWPATNEPPLQDKLHGEFATPDKSKLEATIEAGNNILPTFDIAPKSDPSAPAPSNRGADD